jgi:hypothetical protein
MDSHYMVKQRLGQIKGRFFELSVYTTGEPSWYLFKPLQEIIRDNILKGKQAVRL